MTGLDGIDWLNERVAAGRATRDGDGLKLQYWAKASDVLPFIDREPHPANARVVFGEDYVMSADAVWNAKSNPEAVQACTDDAPLYIEVWDMD
jgi:hypothetical protein